MAYRKSLSIASNGVSQSRTAEGFTVLVCTGCGTEQDEFPPEEVLDTLRGAVRRCPHGMLVSVPCLFGAPVCAARTSTGVIAALQPCTTDRAPNGNVRVIGPIRDLVDAAQLRAWVQAGRWNPGLLPSRMRDPFR
jgi:hypothetical protein